MVTLQKPVRVRRGDQQASPDVGDGRTDYQLHRGAPGSPRVQRVRSSSIIFLTNQSSTPALSPFSNNFVQTPLSQFSLLEILFMFNLSSNPLQKLTLINNCSALSRLNTTHNSIAKFTEKCETMSLVLLNLTRNPLHKIVTPQRRKPYPYHHECRREDPPRPHR